MDYDGNDFQSQNFQLSGEDNSRSSSGLRSFSLPKFELEEHYQVHLRFDSLVGPEPLLGIQEQEESSWIEDFSSGNTALEFTPGAAESCSIPRRKNVWSEATSSESVEILLRSVGEDDVIDKRTAIFDLDTHNGPSILNNRMDLSCVQDVSLRSNEAKDMDSNSVPPVDKCEENLRRINKDVTTDLPDVEDMSNTFSDEDLGSRVFEELDEGCKGEKANTCVLPEQCGSKEIITLPAVESCVTKEKSADISSSEMTINDGHLDDEFVDKNASNVHVTSTPVVPEGSKDATMEQVDTSTSSVNVSANDFEKLPIQNFAEHVTENYREDVLHAMSQNLVSDDGQTMESQIMKTASGHEHKLSEGYRIDHSIDVQESSSSFKLKVEPSSSLVEGCNEHVVSEKSDGLLEDIAHQIEIVSSGMSGHIVTTACKTQALVAEVGINPDGHSVKISSSDKAKQSTSMKIDSFEQMTEGPYDASVELKVSFEKHDLHVENALLEKNTELIKNSEEKKLGRSVIVAEEHADAESHLHESSKNADSSGSFVEPEILKNTGYEGQGTEEKADDNLMIHLPEFTSQDPGSAEIQKNAEDETLENDMRIVGDTVNAPSQVVEESAKLPNSNDEGCVGIHVSHLQDARSLEKCNTVLETEDGNSDVHTTLLAEKACTKASTSSDNLNPRIAEKPQDASALNRNNHIQVGHVEGQLAEGTIQTVTGDAVSCKNSLQSVSYSGCSSEPHSLEGGDGDPSSFQPGCGSPTVISCSQPSGEVEQQELNRKLSDQTHPMSGDLTQAPSSGKNSEEIKSAASDPKESNASEDRSFTFEVRSVPDISESASVGGCKPFSVVQSHEPPQAEQRCSVASALKQTNLKSVHGTPDTDNKSTHRDKNRSVSGSSGERSTTSKRKSVKETRTLKEAAEKSGTPCNPLATKASTVSRDMQLDEKYQYSHSEGAGVKLSCASSLQTSNFPDLNTGAALFLQPFTDVQQVQLRAQIFVYGSLIQGIPPEETCMISAFGNTDGARNAWDAIWHMNLERFNSQKSPTANLETPLLSRSGVRVHEPVSRSSPLQSKAGTTPVSRINSKGASTVLSNFTSLPSPLWNFSPNDSQSNLPRGLNLDPNQILPPLHGHQSSHGKHHSGIGNPWLSQASPVPWVASSQSSTIDTKAQFSAAPIAETVQLTPIRDSSVLNSSNQQFLTSTVGVPLAVSATSTMHMEPGNKISSQAEKNATGNQKTRKRRKSAVSEEPAKVLSAPPLHKELDSATSVTKHQLTPIVSLPVISSPLASTHFQIIGSHGNEQKVIFSEETCSKIEQAKLQAEDAAAFAAAAIKHMEGIWSQLSAQKNSGLGSEKEMKLASAAVAAAAASSVAKAAAAAAKVASDAAMQAKMMADEAMSNRIGNSAQGSQTVDSDLGTDLSRVTSVSVFKGKDKAISSGSVILAAKEAARKRVEAASAASKRAENLDAIVKAAELAVVAVSQAGAVIAMGDPLPFKLSDLIDAGPDSYWKAQHPLAEDATNAETHREKQMALSCSDGHNEPLQGLNSAPLNTKHTQYMIDEGDKSSHNELRESMENQTGVSGPSSFDILAPDYNKNSTVMSQKEKNIQERSLVEVLFDEDSSRRVWYSAKVLSLKDGKAYVCINDHSNAGSGKLKEWISLEGEADKPPRIRIAHPTTSIKYEGTRKRRRAALGSYVWAVGDRVDAWTNDGWCEGVVTDKNKEDETKLTVCFSAGGDSSIVRAWHLRPSLIWKDSQWVEWSRLRENTSHLQEGDTPQEKRQKLGRLVTENDHDVKNVSLDKQSADHQIEYSRKPEESRPLLLSDNDKIFSVGKNAREDNNSGTLSIKRTGPKEGSRVVFGVPRPGKKRKFMEVSKHYVTGKINNVSGVSDAVKHTKYLPPQTSGGWKNSRKMDPKGRKGGEPKPKVTRPIKPQSTQTKGVIERDGSFLTTVSTSNSVVMGQCPLPIAKASTSHEEISEKIIMETLPLTNNLGMEESTLSESSIQSVPGILASRKKTIMAIESDVGAKGKVASAWEKTKNEEKHSNLVDHLGKTISDANELRRSSRRIQPTSRLLEGLQSSMVISKIPSVSHEKGARASQRNTPSSKGSIHGC